ncbi:MAG TPA: acetamidase/formamidase family protein [Candidatus Angelobacter sp.]|jgi:acetamidase/formamidase|nr:acetamidase/formamidase family protein [Candidatus Angelobacter sp.]
MRKAFLLFSLIAMSSLPGIAQSRTRSSSNSPNDLSGRWIVTAEVFGTPVYYRLNLTQQGDKLTGNFIGDKLEGTVTGNTVQFHAQDERGTGWEDCKATVGNGVLSGTVTFVDASDQGHPQVRPFTAKLVPTGKPSTSPQRHEFTPTNFYRRFSAEIKPVLTIQPGDTIHTTTVDAGGVDEKGVRRVLGGNPETGPFYIDGAYPGDTLAVHIVRLKLNRDYAISDDGIVDRGLTSDLAIKAKDNNNDVRWHLDLQRGVATPEKPGEHMKTYSAPLRPMLGCVATAVPPAAAPPSTGDSGRFGGNMDFNEIVEGATVYLPVSVPGALLYFGDGHALQGDGELNGNALETSMDVEVTVDVMPAKPLRGPRVESATHIMAMGLDGSLDGAFRNATDNMANWLMDTYKLTASEVAQVIGTAAEYKVSEVADRNAGIVLKINKERLQSLPK